MSRDVNEKEFPLETDCEADKEPVTNKRPDPLVSEIAKCVAVPPAVTEPPVICGTVTLRPDVSPSAGPVNVILVLFPNETLPDVVACA